MKHSPRHDAIGCKLTPHGAPRRTLALRGEQLRHLAMQQLADVHGGVSHPCGATDLTCPV